jgi:hypothetical protein
LSRSKKEVSLIMPSFTMTPEVTNLPKAAGLNRLNLSVGKMQGAFKQEAEWGLGLSS